MIASLPTLPTYALGSSADITSCWAISPNVNSFSRGGLFWSPWWNINNPKRLPPMVKDNVTGEMKRQTIADSALGTNWFYGGDQLVYTSTEWIHHNNFFLPQSENYVGQYKVGGGFITGFSPITEGVYPNQWNEPIINWNFDTSNHDVPALVAYGGYMEDDNLFLYFPTMVNQTYHWNGKTTRDEFLSTWFNAMDGNTARSNSTLQDFDIPEKVNPNAIGFLLNGKSAAPYNFGLNICLDPKTNQKAFYIEVMGQFSSQSPKPVYAPHTGDILDPAYIPGISTRAGINIGGKGNIAWDAGSVEDPKVPTTFLRIEFYYQNKKIWTVPLYAETPVIIDGVFNTQMVDQGLGYGKKGTIVFFSSYRGHAYIPLTDIIEAFPSKTNPPLLFTGAPLLGNITYSWQQPENPALPPIIGILPYNGIIPMTASDPPTLDREIIVTAQSQWLQGGNCNTIDGFTYFLNYFRLNPLDNSVSHRIGY